MNIFNPNQIPEIEAVDAQAGSGDKVLLDVREADEWEAGHAPGAAWIPLGDFDLGVEYEHHTSHPAPGEILFYPGGLSETEILFPYGGARFASIVGQLAGNHFLTIVEGGERLRELGRLVLWEGAQDVVFDRS